MKCDYCCCVGARFVKKKKQTPVEGGRIIRRRKSLCQFHDQVTVAIFNKEGYSLHLFKHLFTVAITNQVGMSTVSFKLKSLWPYAKVG